MAEYTNIQLAQAEVNTTVATQLVNNSRDYHETFGEGVMVTIVGMGVVFAVLVIMILFINLFKKIEPMLDNIGLIFASLVVISYRNSQINESFNENEKLKTSLAAIQKENEQLNDELWNDEREQNQDNDEIIK